MPPRKGRREKARSRHFWKEVRDWSALALGVVGGLLGILGYVGSQRSIRLSEKTAATADAVASQQDLSAAWDFLGGHKGTTLLPVEGRRPADSDITLALRSVDQALRRDGSNANARWLRGVCMQYRGRRRDAESDYREALKLDPTLWRAHNSLGNLFLERGDFDAALGAYKAAAKYKSSEVIRYNIGVAHFRKQDYGSASKAFREAIAENASFGEGYLALAESLRRTGAKDEAARVEQRLVTVQATVSGRTDPPLAPASAPNSSASGPETAVVEIAQSSTATSTGGGAPAPAGGSTPYPMPPFHSTSTGAGEVQLPELTLPGFTPPERILTTPVFTTTAVTSTTGTSDSGFTTTGTNGQ